MKWCNLCRVHPGQLDVRGLTLCHSCLGKTAHMIGLSINAAACPPLSHCTDRQVVGQTGTTSQSAITLGMGLFLLAAAATTFWLYSQQSGSKSGSPMKFGFGLSKSPTGR